MPKYIIKMPQEANTDTIKTNGTQPNQNFENFLPKIIVPNPFFENPQFKKPKTNSAHSKKKNEENVEKHTFELIVQRFELGIEGFLVKINFGLV